MDFWSVIPGMVMVALGCSFAIYHADIRAWFRWYYQPRDDAKGPSLLVGSSTSTDTKANLVAWAVTIAFIASGITMILYGITQ